MSDAVNLMTLTPRCLDPIFSQNLSSPICLTLTVSVCVGGMPLRRPPTMFSEQFGGRNNVEVCVRRAERGKKRNGEASCSIKRVKTMYELAVLSFSLRNSLDLLSFTLEFVDSVFRTMMTHLQTSLIAMPLTKRTSIRLPRRF